MNRRTFNKYLLAAPVGLVALLTRPLASSVSPVKEKDEELNKGKPSGDRITAWGKSWAEPLPQEKTPIYQNDKYQWYVSNDGTSWKRTNLLSKKFY